MKIRLKNFPDVGPIYSVSLRVPESEVCAGLATRSCFLICALQRKQVGLKLSKDTKAVLYKVTCKAKMKKKKKDYFFPGIFEHMKHKNNHINGTKEQQQQKSKH